MKSSKTLEARSPDSRDHGWALTGSEKELREASGEGAEKECVEREK